MSLMTAKFDKSVSSSRGDGREVDEHDNSRCAAVDSGGRAPRMKEQRGEWDDGVMGGVGLVHGEDFT
ncbi:unnamed protein product [Lampetra planeri]